MQRQSLGSPASKHHHHSHGFIKDNATITLTSPRQPSLLSTNYDEEMDKPLRSAPSKPAQKYIHAIPLLTVLCFLILYFSSHDPSQNELAQFYGVKKLHKPIESTNGSVDDEMKEVVEIKKGDVLGIGSLRNLREIDDDEEEEESAAPQNWAFQGRS